jgi:hypothetical protein
MAMSTIQRQGYSAKISLKLIVGADVFDVAKIGRERLVLREPRPLPAGAAVLSVTVGNTTTEQSVVLSPQGDGDCSEIKYW